MYIPTGKILKVNTGRIWRGRPWSEAILLSILTKECGIIQELKTGNYYIYSYDNQNRIVKTKIPDKYTGFCEEIKRRVIENDFYFGLHIK